MQAGTYLPQTTQGLGSGFVEIPLIVAAHTGCLLRSDVATITGFLVTLKILSGQVGDAVCSALMKRYKPEIFEIERAPNGDVEADSYIAIWGALIIVSSLAIALALPMAVIFIPNVGLVWRLGVCG